jgi:hypothetical protein
MARHTGATIGDCAAKRGSGGEAFVTMVKPADLRNRDHLAAIWRLDGASIRAVFVERQMGARVVIVIGVRDQDPTQVPLVDHNYMVKTLAANRADDALDIRVLPRRSRRRHDLRYVNRFDPAAEFRAIRCVAVSQQVAWRGVPRKCLGDLAREPTCGGVLRDVQMQNLAPRVAEDHAHVQQTKRSGEDHKHIDGGNAVDLIAQEGPPGW